MDPIAERNLQALPVEVLDMILLKAVTIPLLKRRAELNCIISPKRFDQEIKSLRTVWSEWNYRLTKRWFWIKLKRLSRFTLTILQKRIRMKHHVDGIVKLKDRICVLSWNPSSIRVYKGLRNFSLEREIGLPLDDNFGYSPTIEPSVKSNSVYVSLQYRLEIRHTILKVNIDEDDALTIWLDHIQSLRNPVLTVARNDNVLVLINNQVYLYSPEAELLSSVEMKDQFTLHPWKILVLPQGNFVIGCTNVWNLGYMRTTGEIVCEEETISSFVARENSVRTTYLRDNLISSSEFKHLSLNIKEHLMFLINRNADSLLLFDTTSLSLVQSIPLEDEWSMVEVTEVSKEMCDRPSVVEGLCFDTEKRVLYVGNRWEGTIDIYKVY